MSTFEEGTHISLHEYEQRRNDRIMEYELQSSAYYMAMLRGQRRLELAAKMPTIVTEFTDYDGLHVATIGMLDADFNVTTERQITITNGMFENIEPALEIHSYALGKIMVVASGYLIDYDDGVMPLIDDCVASNSNLVST